MDATSEKKSKYFALLFTFSFHALVFLLFILIVFITPIPAFEVKPVPEIEIGLGMEGLGNMQSGGSGDHDKELATNVVPAKAPAISNNAPNVVTDPTETAVNIKTNPKSQKDTHTDAPTTEEEKASAELQNALAKMKSLKDHKGKGEGDGHTGGSGDGDKQGVGDGPGEGIGNGTPGGPGGIGWDLKGRKLVKKPDNMTDAEEEGTVVVEIIVDETGKVIKATPGARGTNTASSRLRAKARGAALQIKFNPSPGIKEQRGTYTFVFTLQ
jgi:outer membrane biosynthesis protein TonB